MKTEFSSNSLTPLNGSLYGYLNENSNTGSPLGMFWNFHLPFMDTTIDGIEVSPAVLIDWMTWPVKSWREFDGLKLEKLIQPELLEVSFYLHEHQDAVLRSLRISNEAESKFKIEFELNIPELVGPNGSEWENVWIKKTSSATLDGFYIIPGNLEPGPKSAQEAEALLGKYLSVHEFEKPFWDKDFRYTFLPSGFS